MTRFTCTEPQPGTLRLEGEITIFGAAAIKEALLEKLHAASALQIDLSGITEIDVAGLQLLLMLKREALRERKTVQWQNHSVAVLQALDILNLGGELDAPAAIVWS